MISYVQGIHYSYYYLFTFMKDTHTKERMDAKKDRIEARLKDAQADVKEAWVNAKEKAQDAWEDTENDNHPRE